MKKPTAQRPRVADLEEIYAFWTSVVRDEERELRDRLKASELRAKAMGAFLDRVEHTGAVEVREDRLAAILEQLK